MRSSVLCIFLTTTPSTRTDYAAALDNYAALYNNAGQQDIAGQMWLKALHLRSRMAITAALPDPSPISSAARFR